MRLAPGARVRWREIVVLGRDGEPPGTLHAAVAADLAGQPLLRHDVRVGPHGAPGWNGPAGIGDARVVGSVLAGLAAVSPAPVPTSA